MNKMPRIAALPQSSDWLSHRWNAAPLLRRARSCHLMKLMPSALGRGLWLRRNPGGWCRTRLPGMAVGDDRPLHSSYKFK